MCIRDRINTLRGNYNWMRAREKSTSSPLMGADLEKIWPVIYPNQSDSASFDNALELLVMGGYSLAHAMMLLIPEAWESHTLMDEKRRAFYEYHAAMMEPWDGPAAVAFTDGCQIGATLDRNGLRPARYLVTDDDLVVMSSESGVLPIPEERIIKKWRLQPGKMFLIDLDQGRIIDDLELKETLSRQKPYQDWVARINVKLSGLELPAHMITRDNEVPLLKRQQAFGFSQEDINFMLEPLARTGEEATGSMGNDTPLSVLSNKDKALFTYFRQLFAQVTNPPIDSIREQLVMSLVSFIGPKPNLLGINEINPPYRLEVAQPVLNFDDMARLRNIAACTDGKFHSAELDICYPLAWGNEGVEARIASLLSLIHIWMTRLAGTALACTTTGLTTRYQESVSYTHLDVYKRQNPDYAKGEAERLFGTLDTTFAVEGELIAKAPLSRVLRVTADGKRYYVCLLYTSRCV